MTTVIGNYVDRFSEASHALPDDMHMNADYPFMLPTVVACDLKSVTLKSDKNGTEVVCKIRKYQGKEVCYLSQSSSFEKMCKRAPHRFRFRPFKSQGEASETEYRCIVCDELQDETEFSDPADANLCGYCVNERMQGIMAEGREFAPGLNECGRQRELSIQAVCELEMEHAERLGNTVEAAALRRVIKLLNC